MRPAWAAGRTRARLLLSRTIGPGHARTVAECRSLPEGLGALAGSAYGERVQAGQDLMAAERAVAATLVWHLRILAGWLPPAGARLVRALGAWFELANIEARIAALAGDGREPEPFVLGGLATAWPAIDRARTLDELAGALAASSWGERHAGGRAAADLALGLRVAYARRVHEAAPTAAGWVAGASALLVAREVFIARDHERVGQLRRLPAIAGDALSAGSLSELGAALPRQARWSLDGIGDPAELWRGELDWWRVVEREARTFLSRRSDAAVVVGVMALLAADAHRTVLALRSAAAGRGANLVELGDAVS